MIMDPKQIAEDGKWKNAENWIAGIGNLCINYFANGFHLMDHPISGLSTRVKELWGEMENWMEHHNQAHAVKFKPELTPEVIAAGAVAVAGPAAETPAEEADVIQFPGTVPAVETTEATE